jgi:outer membrane receptor protein involved in Fe transport
MEERLKLTGSVRFDKNEFFDGFFSPRLSVVYNIGAEQNQNIRVSVQQGFRNPTTQDLFIGLNAGRAILVGSAPDNLDRDVRQFALSGSGQTLTGQQNVSIVGRAAYDNAFSLASVSAGNPTAVNTPLVKPEEITAYEVGYRAQFDKVSIDLSGYYNRYKNFISNTTVVVPFYGQAGDGGLSLLALQNGDFFPYQTYTNSLAEIESWGAVIGIDTKILGNFDLGVSYTYADLDFNQGAFPDFRTNFNSPNHKVKASFGNTALFENFGFNVNYRWSDSYFWQATFADGFIDAFQVVDAQINYAVPSIKSTFKAGASNLLGHEYFSAVGTGAVGSLYYLAVSINP